MSEEEQLSRRLHGLVAQPPAGRNFVPAIHRTVARRKARLLVLSSGLGVTTLVIGGAAASGTFDTSTTSNPPLVGGTPSSTFSTLAAATQTPVPLAPPPTSAAAQASLVAPAPTPSAQSLTLLPVVPSASQASFFYARTDNEQYGIRTVGSSWLSRTAQPGAPSAGQGAVRVFRHVTHYNDEIPWAQFSVVPTAAQLHDWMFGTPQEAAHFYGYDLTGTARGNEYAFDEGLALIQGTPSTPAFRLAVVAAIKRVPGVVVAGPATDAVGRQGIQLSLHSAPNVGIGTSTEREIIDPVDGSLLQGEITDASICPAGSLIWRAVYLESGIVPDAQTTLPETVTLPSGQPANCVEAGEDLPPGAAATSRPPAK